MSTKPLPKPTEFELDLLRALWARQSATVRELHDDLNRTRPLGYTTVLKTLQIMTEKGLVQRVEAGKAHIYTPTATQQQTQHQLILDLSERLFAGSAAQLAMQALSMHAASSTELDEIRTLIEKSVTKSQSVTKSATKPS
ncbi:MAG: BlaI/MecI/CopY family transcriptional regulator [Acidobacteriota bacterium]